MQPGADPTAGNHGRNHEGDSVGAACSNSGTHLGRKHRHGGTHSAEKGNDLRGGQGGFSLEQVSEHIVEQIADVSVPQITEEMGEVIKSVPDEQIQEHIMKDTVEMIQSVAHEPIREWFVGEFVGVHVLQVTQSSCRGKF